VNSAAAAPSIASLPPLATSRRTPSASAFDRADVHEDILAAVIRLDEA
jgi:hypothetical protein